MQPQPPALRPLGIGDIIDATVTLVRSRPLVFIVIAAVPQLVFSILGRLVGFARSSSVDEVADAIRAFGTPGARPVEVSPAAVTEVGALALIALVAAVVLFSVQAGALVEVTARRYLGQEVAIGAALGAALRAAPRLVAAGVLVTVSVILGVAVAAVAFFVVVGVSAVLIGPLATLLALLAFIGIVAVAFYLVASWYVAPVAVMLEGAGPLAALRRSWWLASGSRWRILGLLLLIVVLQAVLSILFSLLFLAAFVSDETVSVLLQEAANLAASAVAGPLQWGTSTLLYYDLRVRREAYDLRLAAEALPRSG